MKNKLVTVKLEMSSELDEMIEKISEKKHISKDETVLNAFLLLKTAVEEEEKGNHIGIVDNSDHVIEKIVGF